MANREIQEQSSVFFEQIIQNEVVVDLSFDIVVYCCFNKNWHIWNYYRHNMKKSLLFLYYFSWKNKFCGVYSRMMKKYIRYQQTNKTSTIRPFLFRVRTFSCHEFVFLWKKSPSRVSRLSVELIIKRTVGDGILIIE